MNLSAVSRAFVKAMVVTCVFCPITAPADTNNESARVEFHLISMWEAIQHLGNYDLEVTVRHLTQQDDDERLELSRQYQIRRRGNSVLSVQHGLQVLSMPTGSLVVDTSRRRIVISSQPRSNIADSPWTSEKLRETLSRLAGNAGEVPRYRGLQNGDEVFESESPEGEIVRTILHIDANTHLLSKLMFFHKADGTAARRSEIGYKWRPTKISTAEELTREFYVTGNEGALRPTPRFAGYTVVQLD